MFDSPDIDAIVARHDSDYINGTKNMFVTCGDFDEPEDEESWDDLPDEEKQRRRDALDKWLDWRRR